MAETVANGLDLRSFPPPHQHRPVDAGGEIVSPPRKKPADLEEHDTAIYPVRPSQAAVDQVYKVRSIGIGATVLLALLLPGIPGIFWAAPWYAENILKPESQGRILSGQQTANALATFAEASKATAENQKLALAAEERREAEFRDTKNALQGVIEAIQQNNSEARKMRQKLDELLESK